MRLIDNLIITQDGIRESEPLNEMIRFVKRGGFFTQGAIKVFGGRDQKPIIISQLPDGQDYIHNGHHRVLAVYLGGRVYIRDDEYALEPRTYEEYLTPNLGRGFVTPFDPRRHMRIPDFSAFKQEIMRLMFDSSRHMPVNQYIELNAYRYRVPRVAKHIHYLAESLLA